MLPQSSPTATGHDHHDGVGAVAGDVIDLILFLRDIEMVSSRS